MKLILAAGLALGMTTASAFAQTESYEIMAPAAPGGGYDQTARAMQTVMQEAGIASDVQVVNVPGAGGAIGLAQFAQNRAGDPTGLFVGGYVLVGALLTNNSPVTLDDVTPIARLTGEAVAIVVPAASPYQTIDDLAAAMKEDPGSVAIAGGSAGGADHIAVGLFAQAADVDPTLINYVAFSGGGEALAAILGNQVAAGASGFGEFESQIEAGTMRLLAVTGENRIEGVDAPTLSEAGYDVVLENWRMVAAGPDLEEAEVAQISADIDAMVQSDQWQETLTRNNWANTYLAGEEFQTTLQQNIEDTREILTTIGLVKQ